MNQPKKHPDNYAEEKISFDNWVCGIKCEENKIQLILCEKWDADAFAKQLFYLDIESKLNINDENLKTIYNDLNKNHKEEIIDFISTCFKLLKHITVPFLIKIKDKLEKKNYQIFCEIATTVDKEKNNKHGNQIVLKEQTITDFLNEVTKSLVYQNDFNDKKSWELFKSIEAEERPLTYSYKKNPNSKKKTNDYLFGYSFMFYRLIRYLKKDFNTFFTEYYENDNEIIDIDPNEVKQINTNIEKIDNYFL